MVLRLRSASARARVVCLLCLLTSASTPKVRGAGCSFHRSFLLLYYYYYYYSLMQLSQGGLVVRKAPGVSTATYIFWGRFLKLLHYYYYYYYY